MAKMRDFLKSRVANYKRVNLLGNGKIMSELGKILAPCDIYDDKFSEITYDSVGNRLMPSKEILNVVAESNKNNSSLRDFAKQNRGNPKDLQEKQSNQLQGGLPRRFCESARNDKLLTTPQDKFTLDSTLSIISPGIPPHSFLAQNAPNIISEYDLFAPVMSRSVWISGTNGKTTTTQMTTLLLRDLGAQSGGNIGTPLCNLDLDSGESRDLGESDSTDSSDLRTDSRESRKDSHDSKHNPTNSHLWILETSSFMLHYTNTAKPDIYALLPITADHISWHSDFESYVASKLKPLAMMDKNSSAIIPKIYADSPQAKAFKGKLYLYDSAESLANLFGINPQKLRFKGAFLLDSILSLAIAKLLTGKIDYDLMNSFQIDSHKIEEFFDAKNRLFVDDSKATNISAVEEALKIYKDKFIFLILGGDNKGVSLAPLVEILRHYRLKVFAIGACENHIKELCDESHIECEVCGDLQNAVAKIKAEFCDTQNQICLLSPACASLDQFKSYAERGDLFKKYALS